MKAIPYIRFSSTKQQHGSSVARQQEAIGKWMLNHPDYTLSNLCFTDLGISGWSGEHSESGGFSKLLVAIEAGAIKAGDCVLVEAMDRAGRLPPFEMVTLIGKVLNAGVLLVTLDDGMTYTQESANGQHLFLLVAKFQQANQYSEALSRRIKASYADRRTKAAAGLSVKRSTPVWIDKEGLLIESLAPFIVQVFEDYAIGLGERRIYDRIQGKHPLLTKLNPSTIKRWMTNTTAIGMWGDIPDVHPPVISKELFYRVQRRLGTPSKPKAAPTNHLLTGLVKCGVCNSNMIYKALSHSPHVMACGKRARFGAGDKGCSNKTNWPVMLLEGIRLDTYIAAVQRGLLSTQASASEQKRIVLEGEINTLTKTIARLVALIAIHDIPEVQASYSAAVNKREQLQYQLAAAISTPDHPSYDYAYNYANDLYAINDDQQLNALLQQAGYVITCIDNTATVLESSPYSNNTTEQLYIYKGVKRSKAGSRYHYEVNGKPQSVAVPVAATRATTEILH